MDWLNLEGQIPDDLALRLRCSLEYRTFIITNEAEKFVVVDDVKIGCG